jgi:ACS family hexuronate transporter-like MFS transporter
MALLPEPWVLALHAFFLALPKRVISGSNKSTAEWFPKKERALATGFFNSGSNIGAIIAPLSVPWIAKNYGWQWAFIITGGIGFIWLALWFIYYEIPLSSKN